MLYPIEENKLHGFINSKGEIIVEPKYTFVQDFSEGLCCVCITVIREGNVKFKKVYHSGYINAAGEEIIRPQFLGLGKPFREGMAMVYFEEASKWGFIDTKGEMVTPPQYEQEHSYGFSEGLAGVGIDEKWGYINHEGNTVIPFEYDWTNPFSNGLAIVKKNGKKSFIDKNGVKLKTIKCTIVDTVNGKFKDGFSVVKIGKQYGLINTEGQLAFQELFDGIWGFHEGLCAVEKDGKYGYINIKGEYAIPPQFEDARPHNGGVAIFVEHGKYGLIDLSGKIIKEPTYDYIDYFGGNLTHPADRDLTHAVLGKDEYYINRLGEIVAEKIRKTEASESQEDILKAIFNKMPEKKNVWDKAKWYYDGVSVTKKSAIRHIYFVLKWLKEKQLLTEEGLEWYKVKNNLDIGLYRSMVNEQAADFLDKCYTKWYENESIANFQIDPNLKFTEDENLNRYWTAYMNSTPPSSTLPQAKRTWWQKFLRN